MRFSATMHIDEGIASIRMAGELDAAGAPRLQELIAEAAHNTAARLVLLAKDLSYISSAGLRCLVFAHQKMGPSVDIVLVGARPAVAETIMLTGFDQSMIMFSPDSP
jgi:anti-anti-sigma factor